MDILGFKIQAYQMMLAIFVAVALVYIASFISDAYRSKRRHHHQHHH